MYSLSIVIPLFGTALVESQLLRPLANQGERRDEETLC